MYIYNLTKVSYILTRIRYLEVKKPVSTVRNEERQRGKMIAHLRPNLANSAKSYVNWASPKSIQPSVYLGNTAKESGDMRQIICERLRR